MGHGRRLVIGLAEHRRDGVYGYAALSEQSTGIWGDSVDGAGVYGSSGTYGVIGYGTYGVYGFGTYGVTGTAESTGVGVYGWVGPDDMDAPSPPGGIGVYARAETTSQVALRVSGKVKFSRAGRTYLTRSARSKTIRMSGVTSSSYVIATVQTSASGVYVRAVVPASGKFTIHLSKAGGKRIYVGYMVIN